jgi:hypothetical protein
VRFGSANALVNQLIVDHLNADISAAKSFIIELGEMDPATHLVNYCNEYYLCERWLEGRATKFTNTKGEARGKGLLAETVAALGHFSIVATKKQMLLADLQGEAVSYMN